MIRKVFFMGKWIWQHENWPNFEYDISRYVKLIDDFKDKSLFLSGKMAGFSDNDQMDATIDLMLSEAIKTNAIEGENLDRDSVRSSILRLISSEAMPHANDEKASGAASLIVDVRKKWKSDLSHELLGQWQTSTVPDHITNLILRGHYRVDPAPMQIVSGYIGKTRVHYEAPPSSQVEEEMNILINWYNNTNAFSINDESPPDLIRAGIAHLWFECIHPFDDGNGRVGRAISDHAISQALGYPTLACLSTAIAGTKKEYYRELNIASQSNININGWLDYFINTSIEALNIAEDEVDFILSKTRFYDKFSSNLNERQQKVVSRIFKEGRKGFQGGITPQKYMAITKCSSATATRDLANLVKKGSFYKAESGGRSTRYEIKLTRPKGFSLETQKIKLF